MERGAIILAIARVDDASQWIPVEKRAGRTENDRVGNCPERDEPFFEKVGPAMRSEPRLWGLLVLIALLLAPVGCFESAGDRLVGKWDATVDSDLPGASRAAMSDVSVTLAFQKSGRMTAHVTTGARTKCTAGEWKVVEADGEKLTIETQKGDGKRKRTERLTVTFDGDDRCKIAKGDGRQVLSLTRR
jgi:hypothetical protein